MTFRFVPYALLSCLMLVAACDTQSEASYPQTQEDRRKERLGKLTGEGLTIGGQQDEEGGSRNPLGVNSFLWRATLDTLAFMPMASADPFGGVIITDWYEDPNARGERFKITALILDRRLRADGVKISLFKQASDPQKGWRDVEVADALERQIEDTILTRARQLRVKQLETQP